MVLKIFNIFDTSLSNLGIERDRRMFILLFFTKTRTNFLVKKNNKLVDIKD